VYSHHGLVAQILLAFSKKNAQDSLIFGQIAPGRQIGWFFAPSRIRQAQSPDSGRYAQKTPKSAQPQYCFWRSL